ncbi:MAG: STM4011 family radical SAM protein [Saprospiraceae bacterium]|nr:STM4011 family radical SAM protein [Saprospiraceae bacterium]
MKKALRILYRGPLESCNYDCSYCPFAKKKNTRKELAFDRTCLLDLENWVAQQNRDISILFTPWGEALIRKYYQEALQRFSWMPNVKKVSIQTNLSGNLAWVKGANPKTLALWTTFHPTETTVSKFLDQCQLLIQHSIPFSVGIVGKKENFHFIQELKDRLPSTIYLWVNAYKRQPNYYSPTEQDWLQRIDPLFSFNNTIYETRGKGCAAGETSISIDGAGNVTRCHFIKKQLGNIYQQSLDEMLSRQPCTNAACRCYIGYINLKELKLKEVYSDRILERIPIDYHSSIKDNNI